VERRRHVRQRARLLLDAREQRRAGADCVNRHFGLKVFGTNYSPIFICRISSERLNTNMDAILFI
jgi:hypothetical protein